MLDVKLFFLEKEKMLLGKIDNKRFMPYSRNDKFFIESNFYNLFGKKIYLTEIKTEYNGSMEATIAYDKDGNIYIVLYKEKPNDNFVFKAEKIYNFIYENNSEFLREIQKKFKPTALLSNIKCMVISSAYMNKDYVNIKKSDLKYDLYTWQEINKILVLSHVFTNYEENIDNIDNFEGEED